MPRTPYRDFAAYYDDLMAGRYVRQWWTVFRRLAAARHWRFNTVADLAGGTGEAARRFARLGARVYVVDRARDMLARAQQRVPAAHGLCQDLRRLRLPEKVDLAVSVFGGLNYLRSLAEVSSVFRRVRANLKDGGLICVDAVTPWHLRHNFGGGADMFEGRGYVSLWRYRWEPDRVRSRIRVDGFMRRGTGWIRHRPEEHVHYGYSLPAWRRALRQAGFSRVEAFGLPYGTPPAARDTHWLFLAQAGA
jgi:SAM-dependent methyltransferase